MSGRLVVGDLTLQIAGTCRASPGGPASHVSCRITWEPDCVLRRLMCDTRSPGDLRQWRATVRGTSRGSQLPARSVRHDRVDEKGGR
ncbi:MAG: hypothetical protein QOI07_4009 [Verrucomicrobiota bacterium]|jgi:hypothetical protein